MPVAPLTLPAEQRAALHAAYAIPPRAYHNVHHVEAVLGHYDAVAGGPGWNQPCEAYLAVLYHDAIYDVGRSDNEARSAELAGVHVARWLRDSGIDVGVVKRLINLTAHHGKWSPSDFAGDGRAPDTTHFLDCDMAILGAEPDEFDAYDRGIAAEYRGSVPGFLFNASRRRFLKQLLARDRIFVSDFFHDRYDASARNNLRRAVTTKR
ncbi:MAG: hypothetical protein ABIO38_09085 [Luteimonas sp.]